MKFFEIIPSGTQYQFVRHRWYFIWVSIVLVVLSIGAMVQSKIATGSILNFGIDFAGGSQVQLALEPSRDPGIEAIRSKLAELYEGSSAVSVPDKEHEVLIRVKKVLSIDEATVEQCSKAVETVPKADGKGETKLVRFNHPPGGSKFFLKYDAEPAYTAVQQAVNAAGCQGTADRGFGATPGEYPVDFSLVGIGAKLQGELDDAFGGGTVKEIVRSETVGAKVGNQLKEDGAKAMLYAIGFIFLYVMIRFDLRFAPGGIVALTHDAFLVVGAFAATGKEFNVQTIAAVLTIIGYSINDTIVVFDRVRERIALERTTPIEEITNKALNDTLSRTILTSGSTLLVVVAVYVLGAGAIKDFAFALLVGILVGTYSSIFIASPVFLWVNHRFYGGKGHLQGIEEEPAAARPSRATEAGEGDVIDTTARERAETLDNAGEDEEGAKKATRRRRRPRPS